MVSLKPPWRQKNPVMEKACQAYHKQTAPAELVRVIDKLRVTTNGSKLEKEIVWNGKKYTPKGSFPATVAFIKTGKGEVRGMIRVINYEDAYQVKAGKVDYISITISYGGKSISLPEGHRNYMRIEK